MIVSTEHAATEATDIVTGIEMWVGNVHDVTNIGRDSDSDGNTSCALNMSMVLLLVTGF